jgi:predicted porin
MKKTLVALAALAATSAFAQSSVTMYGTIDTSISSVSSGGSTDPNNPGNINGLNSYGSAGAAQSAPAYSGRVTGLASGLMSGSRWGIKGTEDLGAGMKANFIMEGALNSAAGTSPNDHALLAAADQRVTGAGDSAANGQLFSREMSVGLSGEFGAVKAGFLSTDSVHANAMVDPFAGGGISPIAFYSSWNGGGSSFTRMATNAVQWNYNLANGSMIEAFYAMGGNTGSSSQGRQLGLLGKFQVTPTASLVADFHQMNDNVSFGNDPIAVTGTAGTGNGATGGTPTTSTIPGLTASYYNSKSVTVGGTWQAASNLTLKAGIVRIVQSTASNGTGDGAIGQNFGIPINQAYYYTYNSNPSRNIGFVGGTYDLTAANHIMAAYYNATMHGYEAIKAPVATTAVTTYGASSYKVMNMAYVHDFSKRTNVYALYQHMTSSQVDGGTQTPGITSGGTQSQNTVAFGLRHSF